MRRTARARRAGFTMIELLVTLSIVAVLLAVAAPSFNTFLARKRVEGAMSELGTDLQYARSEAVARNADVHVTFGSGCYVIHLEVGATATCTRTTKAIIPATAEIRTVQLDSGSPVAITPSNTLTYIGFEPLRGLADWDGTDINIGSVVVDDGSGQRSLRISVGPTGRTNTCSPSGQVKGYTQC